jgi:DNA-binding transcriptional MerR regulator
VNNREDLWRFSPIATNSSFFGLTFEEMGAYVHNIENAGRSVSARSATDLYPVRDVVEILKISRRQLQYWAQTDLIAPSAQTGGGHGRYTFSDLVALKAAKRLIDSGVSVQRIRKSIRALRTLLPTVEQPLAELVLVATGDIVLAFRDGTAFEAVSGQEWVFEVAKFQREIDAWKQSIGALASADSEAKAVGRSGVRDQTA